MNNPINTPPRLLPVLQKTKNTYLLWYGYHSTLPKIHRYTMGKKIDSLFTEIIEAIIIAIFLHQSEKIPFIRKAIQKLDTVKIFLMILWEIKSLDENKYITISRQLEEIGKMLGGWNGQLIKQNSPAKAGEK